MATAKATTDHDEIREWVEARGGHPARVKSTGTRKDPGVLRIDYPGYSGEDTLEEIEWDEFFEWFDRNKLSMLLSEEKRNRFSKLVARSTASRSRKSPSRRVSQSPSKKAASSAKKASSKKAATKKASTKKAPTKKASTTKKASSKKAPPRKAISATRRPGDSATKKSTKRPASTTTTSHDEIRTWVESRGGFPAHVKQTGRKRGDLGVLRIDYPGYSGKDTLQRIDWDQWFDAFERNKLAFLYQPSKRSSRFSKLVNR